MELSKTLLRDFAKGASTQKADRFPKETNTYGTVEIVDNETFVILDGTDIRTPVSSVVEVQTGDRVIVLMKNHSATIIGNITDPVSSNVTAHAISTLIEKEPELEDELLAFSRDKKYALSIEDLKDLIESTPDYENLINKPSIEGVTLTGDKSFEDLNLESLSNVELETLLT